ncbi:MAG TPA: alkaline phosphatase family protein [Solirubrobacteraceae bacterium]|nr:alkaline phosphatase family protein [Solirubrobacteraceae bacterium]
MTNRSPETGPTDGRAHPPDRLTRRTLLKATAGATALVATRGLPAWARPIAHTAGLRAPDSLPFPSKPAGTPSMPEIEHIVVLIMENHSFDNLLGMVPRQVPGRGSVDGWRFRHGKPVNFNLDAGGNTVIATHGSSPCQLDGEPSQTWDASHEAWDSGLNDGFVKASGPVAMRFWDKRDIPFTYSLTEYFPIGERYFCSVLGQTFPNRSYFFAGTSSGTINDTVISSPPANGTIFDRLDAHGIDWKVYYEPPSYPTLELVLADTPARAPRIQHFGNFLSDAAAGRLPQFTFLDPDYTTTSEENPQDIQLGERYIAQVVQTLMRAKTWKHTALFITYDEHGGYYDHVPPPPAVAPDSIPPMLTSTDVPGAFNRYGFRVPLIVVSPWAKPHYVSRVVQDHTSMVAFIERKWNLPAMTYRDANAQPMTDYFNFRKPTFETPPTLAAAPKLGPGLAECHAAGLSPPLTG